MSKSSQKKVFYYAIFVVAALMVMLLHQQKLMIRPPIVTKDNNLAKIHARTISPPSAPIAETNSETISSAIAVICGSNPATADRYEARNDALRAIARERNLAPNDVAVLVSWLASSNDVLHTERLAALKNDVMNLLRNQESPPHDFAILGALIIAGTL